MKKTMFLLLFGVMSFPALSQYSISVKMDWWSWQLNGNEMEGSLYADLYYNGQLQMDTLNYTYYWERNTASVPNTWSSYGTTRSRRHGVVTGDGYAVRVTMSGPGFSNLVS